MNSCSFVSFQESINCDELLSLLANEHKGFLLESSLDPYNLGRYSFFGIDPFLTIQYKDGIIIEEEKCHRNIYKGNIFNRLRSLLNKYYIDKSINFPFLGGAVGFLSYDLGFSIEKIDRRNIDELKIPDLWFGFFDIVICIDRYKNNILIFSSGFPENNPYLRKKLADCRLKEFLKKLSNGKYSSISFAHTSQYSLESNFSHNEYIKSVEKSLDYIIKGDIYQINLSQRFHTKTDLSSEQLYRNLKSTFPVPFGGIIKTEDFSIISGSPERFVKYDGNFIFTRPMKGTRPRSKNQIFDKRFKKELENSQKDKAELLMIVDLERNDLGRVCDYGSVKVESLRNLEEYASVFQTTAQIKGKLFSGMDRIDIIKACFPGGSITGCPKIRAMQIIEELEPNRRGIYTGSLGYFSFSGEMDFNILIRSFLKKQKDVYFGVGGGIVYDSSPELEYQETLVKAQALKMALKGSNNRPVKSLQGKCNESFCLVGR